MGYTHYWKQKEKATKEQAERVYNEVTKLLKAMPEFSETAGGYHNDEPIVLKGGNGFGEAMITENVISFNGDAEKGLGHETFHIELKKLNKDFCKTARKPYDMPVCLCLLSLKNNIPTFELKSDGNMSDWQPAIDLYRKTIGPVTVGFRK